MKETIKQGQGKKRETKHKVSIWQAVGNFTESLLTKQGFSKRFAKKMVWGEKKRGGGR